jgi:pyruvate,orthophosphate dikinase
MSHKYVYLFSEGNANMRELLGGKGAGLAEMTNIGLPVPYGFTITTEACTRYYADNETIAPEIQDQIFEYLGKLEEQSGKKLGDAQNPLLVSVRSGSRASMPGMMDTILNLGINDEVVKVIARNTNNERFAYDSYRRFVQMFADVVMQVPKREFEVIIDQMKEARGITLDTEFTADDLKEMVVKFKKYYEDFKHEEFPEDPRVQLIDAVKAVFRSWNNQRAIYYRKMNEIPDDWGTAVTVQMMAFGNMGETSGSGVGFTRDPATGEHRFFAEVLMNAQGEDVVAGVRTPMDIDVIKEKMPELYAQLLKVADILEQHYRDMQDMEFTIENGKLYMLQCRTGKRTGAAAIKMAVDMVNEGMITKDEALLRVEPNKINELLHPQFDAAELKKATPLTTALPASPGAASGQIVFNAADTAAWKKEGKKTILVRLETAAEDIEGMHNAEGILTVRGGMTSHAAVVARGMGACCVSGASDVLIDEEAKTMKVAGKVFHEGDWISLDGTTGAVYEGRIKSVPASISGDFQTFMGWADARRDLLIRTNADTPKDAEQAYSFGAEGIGLVRTEHMFFNPERLTPIREMIVSSTVEQRKAALAKLLPMQRSDFEGLYEAMHGYPVTIRLLDPPLHEFVPKDDAGIQELADGMNMSFQEVKDICEGLHEFNPMMGHRGCRLDVTYPEIGEMQAQAIIEAAINTQRKHPDWNVEAEIMIPLVGDPKELQYVKKICTDVCDKVLADSDTKVAYHIGTMIEVPRAALLADEIAQDAEFFSFGTNDLTQLTFGFSRDDAGKFLNAYYEKKIYDIDPFQKLDQHGVGKLVKMASDLGRKTRPDLVLGVCGETGGEPSSIEFYHQTGLTYVSCSPYRVPIARLAAAQAAIKYPRQK